MSTAPGNVPLICRLGCVSSFPPVESFKGECHVPKPLPTFLTPHLFSLACYWDQSQALLGLLAVKAPPCQVAQLFSACYLCSPVLLGAVPTGVVLLTRSGTGHAQEVRLHSAAGGDTWCGFCFCCHLDIALLESLRHPIL